MQKLKKFLLGKREWEITKDHFDYLTVSYFFKDLDEGQ